MYVSSAPDNVRRAHDTVTVPTEIWFHDAVQVGTRQRCSLREGQVRRIGGGQAVPGGRVQTLSSLRRIRRLAKERGRGRTAAVVRR